jgi:signal transduction histidine kinase
VTGSAVESILRLKRTQDELQESRQFFQSALNALSSNIAVLDQKGTIVAVNASWCRYGRENGLVWPDCGVERNYFAPLDAAANASTLDQDAATARDAAQGIRAVMAGQCERYWLEYPCHSPTEQRWYTMWVTRFETVRGVRVVVSHENITARKLAEEAMLQAKEDAERARRQAEAARRGEERRRRIAESLRDVLSVLNSTRSLQDVLDDIVVRAGQLLDSQGVAIYQAHDDRGPFCLRAAHGLERAGGPGAAPPSGTEILWRALRMRQPVACDVPGESVQVPYRVTLAVPIVAQEHAFGGMLLYYDHPRTFAGEEIELAALFGDQAALAIENARLRDQVEEAAVLEERSRLAGDLHDAVTQTLFSASVIAESLPRIWDRHPDEALRGLQELGQLTRGALAEMRTLLLELRPASLIERPLGDLLRHLGEAITSRTRVPVELHIEGDDVLPPPVQVVFYRVAQEALNNVAKHAAANRAAVQLSCVPGQAVLRVRDDGRGFDPAAVPAGHMGLDIMRERAGRIGATFQVHSAPARGTEVAIQWQQEE